MLRIPLKKRPGAADTDRRLNLYPWYVAAYQARHPKGLLAVAQAPSGDPDQRESFS